MTLANVQNNRIKYVKLLAKEAEGIPWNKLCVYLIFLYVIMRKGQRENLDLKAVTMKDPVTGLFDKTKYNDKKKNQQRTYFGVRGYIYTLDQWKLCMTKEHNLLIMS